VKQGAESSLASLHRVEDADLVAVGVDAVPRDPADLARSLMFGDFDLTAAAVEDDHITLSFSTLDGIDEFIALCLRSRDELSERIASEDDDGQEVTAAWRYTIRPNAIFVTDTSDEPNIVWSSSATFPRTDLAEVEARIRSRPVQFMIYLEEVRVRQRLCKSPAKRSFPFRSTCRCCSVRWIWSRLWSFQVGKRGR
jgi:hypothetical protein